MSPPTETATQNAHARVETDNKTVNKQPTAAPNITPTQQSAEKADRLRGGCIPVPCPVRPHFIFGLRLGLRTVHVGWMLLLYPHPLLHLTGHCPTRNSVLLTACPPFPRCTLSTISVLQTCTLENCTISFLLATWLLAPLSESLSNPLTPSEFPRPRDSIIPEQTNHISNPSTHLAEPRRRHTPLVCMNFQNHVECPCACAKVR